jgi:hypothetical protein
MEATDLLRTARLTVVEGEARKFADAVYDDRTLVHVWDATTKRRAPNQRGDVDIDRLEQLRWALDRRCLKCGTQFAADHRYGARGDVLCALHAEPSDRLRRGLADFVLDIRDAWVPPRPAARVTDESAPTASA